jgi:tetratricopeptide (TPR) repeat protein/CHAT domain-containing protein
MLHRLWRWLTGLYRRLRQWWHKPTPTPPPSPPRPSFSATELESTFLHLLDWMEQGASRGQMKGFLIAKGIAPSQWTTWLEGFAKRLSDNPTQHRELARRMVQFGELYGEEWGALAAKIGREVLAQVSEPGEKVAEPGEKVAEAGEKVAEAGEKEKDEAQVWFELGYAQGNLGQHEEAIASCNEAIRLRPDYPEAYYNRGIAQGNLGQHEEAIASCNEAIRLRPDYPEAYYNRGIAQGNLGQYEEAIASCNEAIRLRPDFPVAYLVRGNAQDDLRQYEEAIASCNEAIRLRPDFPVAYLVRGNAQDDLRQYEEAIASYNEAIRLRPDYPEAYNNRGYAQDNLGQHEEAIASYNEAIRLRPDFPEAYNNRGAAQRNLGQYEEAIASYNEAIRLRPDYPEAYNNRGAAQGNLGQHEEAIASFNEAIRLRPDYPEAYHNRGNAQGNLGQYEEAIASYDAALILKRDMWDAWFMRGQVANQVDRRNSPYLPSDLALLNPDLNQRGFEGALLTYREGLKSCQKDTHPEGWGTLHFAIGNLYDLRSRRKATNRDPDRRTAFKHYNLALETLTETAYPERHLEVLRPLIRLLLSFDEIEQAQELQRRGTDLVRRLVDCCPSPGKQRQLALQFADFKQLTVDLCVRRGEVGRAFAVAEAGKNACLSWLFYGRADAVTELDWSQMRQLLGGEIPPTPLNKGGLEGVNLNSPPGENPPAPPFPRGAGGGSTPLGTAEVSDQVAPSFPRGAGEIPPTPLNKGGLEGVNLNSPLGENPPAPPFPRGAGGGYTPLGTAEVSDQVAPSFPRGAGEIPPTPLNKGGLEGVNLNSPPGENPPAPPFPRGAGGGSTPLGTAEVSDQVAPSFPRGAGEIPPTPLNKGGLEGVNLNSPLGENPPAPPFPRGAGGGYTPLGTAEVSDQVAPPFPRGAGEIPPTPLNKGGLERGNLNSPLGENPPQPPLERGAGGGSTAAVYWHWSPYALTTFILKPDRPEPTVLNHNRFQDRSEYTGNLRELEDWMQEWNRTYHRNPKDKKDKTTTQSDSWRKGLKAQLDRLAAIVQIDAILDELEDCREYQHLILIPHKDLHRLPLHGLFVNSDRFPRTCTLTYLPSAAFVRPEAPTPSDASRFDALLSVENPPSLTKTADGSHKTLAPLPAAEVESEIVARLFGRNTRLAGTDATAAALKAALQQPHSAFHFSGHGYYEFSHPIASALCLQGEDRLSVEDILSLDLSAYRLVYLSACETAVSGDETITSEYVGLTGAFARSRVAYIVSTLWSVESLGSTLFSLYFYQELERGHPEPVAFANAQQWLKTVTRDRLGDWYRQQIERFENDPSFPRSLLRNFKSWSSSIATMEETPFADPYYWSAFILCGR